MVERFQVGAADCPWVEGATTSFMVRSTARRAVALLLWYVLFGSGVGVVGGDRLRNGAGGAGRRDGAVERRDGDDDDGESTSLAKKNVHGEGDGSDGLSRGGGIQGGDGAGVTAAVAVAVAGNASSSASASGVAVMAAAPPHRRLLGTGAGAGRALQEQGGDGAAGIYDGCINADPTTTKVRVLSPPLPPAPRTSRSPRNTHPPHPTLTPQTPPNHTPQYLTIRHNTSAYLTIPTPNSSHVHHISPYPPPHPQNLFDVVIVVHSKDSGPLVHNVRSLLCRCQVTATDALCCVCVKRFDLTEIILPPSN